MSKQNSRTRRKMAAGFQGVGSHTDFNSKQHYGSLADKAKIVAVSGMFFTERAKSIRKEARNIGLRYGKHIGSKSLYKIVNNIRQHHRQMAALYVQQ